LYFGQGSYGSRSLSVEGSAVFVAAQKIKAKARKYAAHLFQMPEDLVLYENGKVVGTPAPDKAVMTLQQISFTLWLAMNLPPGMDPGLDEEGFFDPPNFNFPFGTHVAIVEVDERTGEVRVVRYVAVDDVGTAVNPRVVDAQTHGNIALGLGQALLEEVVYDREGRILTDSFSSYAMPRAADLPHLEIDRTVTPSPVNPLGAKGAGDTSNPPVAVAIVNAVRDALVGLGVREMDMPLRPEKVWQALQDARIANQVTK
jgi:carbon-monoxide dehydrogenase large subunit